MLPFHIEVPLGAISLDEAPIGTDEAPSGASSLDGLLSYLVHSLGRGSYPSAEVQSVYCATPVDWSAFVFTQLNDSM